MHKYGFETHVLHTILCQGEKQTKSVPYNGYQNTAYAFCIQGHLGNIFELKSSVGI